jgi:hypothetical protein
MSWLQRLDQAHAELADRSADPWRKKVESAVRGVGAMSSAALLDLLRVPATTGTARRLAKIMRSIGFIPIKSRRLMPGGFRDTVTRGWSRPVRDSGYQTNPTQGEKVGSRHLITPMHGGTG